MNQQPQPMAQLAQTSTPARVQIVRVLQLLGILAGFLGGADFLQLVTILPPDWASWLALSGPAFAAGSKPAIMLIGDFMDDGKKNDSFIIPAIAFFAFFILTSCALADSVNLRKNGVIMTEYRDPTTGQEYAAGVGFGANGKPNRAVFEWTNSQGFRVQLVEHLRRHETEVFIRQGKRWVKWPVAGKFILVDNMPPAVNDATANAAAP